jgi:hypothetical protein
MYLAKPLRDLSNEELAEQKITREQFERERAQSLMREDKLMNSVKSGSYRVIISGASHESFSDEPLLVPPAKPGVEAVNQKTMHIVREYTLAFFDKYLRDQKPAKLDSLTNQHSNVKLERFNVL